MTQFETKKASLYLFLSFCFCLSIYIAFNTNVASVVSSKLSLSGRKVLSKISGNITGSVETYDVVKVKEFNNITVEIYKRTSDSESELINKINLPHENDGYFLFHNSSTNLALNDIDGDKIPEIIAPTFDKTLSAHLNVVKYYPDNNAFALMLEPTYQID